MKFFMADPHANHEGILRMCNRPFANVQEHNQALLHQINSYAMKNDELYILGDVAWHDPLPFLKQIVCETKFLICGNHDRPNYAKHFTACMDIGEVRLFGYREKWAKTILCHYPMAYWQHSEQGSIMLYGHLHAAREEVLDEIWPERRSMDVGVDNAKRLLGEYRPFMEADIIDILGSRKGHDPLEFYIERQRQIDHERSLQGRAD